MFIGFAYFHIFYFLVPILTLAVLYKLRFYKSPRYSFPPVGHLYSSKFIKSNFHKKVLFFLRLFTLTGLMLLIARPQWVDPSSNLNVKGVDIVISLDVSGSMRLIDDLKDRRSRIEVAKDEAIRFIDKRHNDPIAVVAFGGDVISRCPLTLDKKILKEVIAGLHIGFINADATLLGSGLATAVNRLRNSKSKSKVVILLTDGVPSHDKVSPDIAVELAKKFGVKVYTIGVGSKKGGYMLDQLGRAHAVHDSIDTKLLARIAKETGGKFFRANNPAEMRQIYDTIDALERTELTTNIFHNYHEAYEPWLWFVMAVFSLKLFLRLFKWRVLA